ncbi:MAG: carboxypeptidase [Alphaproteobacteria bacterium]|nr:carboxypeptidase [Alphaproteobacteria bacterium]
MTRIRRRTVALLAALILAAPVMAPAHAQEGHEPTEAADAGDAKTDKTGREQSVTEGSVTIAGQAIPYEATVGLMPMRDEKGREKATFGYTYYRRTDVENAAARPIVFAYNGGPGSASMWLHMGVLGPRRVVLTDGEHTGPAPYAHVNNEYSVLDVADLVMMDPVGTGYTELKDEKDSKDYWGVDQDAAAAAEFIARFTTESGRWLSPKFMLGESYGGMRGGATTYVLLTEHNMDLNGVILVSPFMDFASGEDGVGIDLPHTLYLSTFAATARYHDLLDPKPSDLKAFLAEVDEWAATDYLLALRKGNKLPEAERKAIARKLASYTGVDADYWLLANLRVSHGQFLKEVQRRAGKSTGRIDARFTGAQVQPLAEAMDYDPYFSTVRAAYTAAFLDYMTNTLKFGADKKYVISGGLFRKWDWGHALPGSSFKVPSPNAAIDFEHAIKQNPSMKVLIQQGYYDMATPFGATDYFVDHMNLTAEERARVKVEYYEAGHMMYVHPGSLDRYAKDLRDFITGAVGK